MTDLKKEFDVTELFHQLEELKKKRAEKIKKLTLVRKLEKKKKNVKKLENKHERTKQLNKPEPIVSLSKCESNGFLEQKASFLKSQEEGTESSISNKLNDKNSDLSKTKLADEEQKYSQTGGIVFYNANADICSNLGPNNLNELYVDSKLLSQSVSSRVSKNETLAKTEFTSKLESETLGLSKSSANPGNCVQEEFRYCGKRFSDTEQQDISGSQLNVKRVKKCSGKLYLPEIKKNNLVNDTAYLLDSCLFNIDKEIHSNFCEQIIPNSIKITNQDSEAGINIEVKLQTISKKHQNIQKDDIELTELNDQSHTNLIREYVTEAEKVSSNSQSFEISTCDKDYICSTSVQSDATLNIKKKDDIDPSCLLADLSKSRSSAKTSKINTEIEIDPNVTEVADTEIGFDKKLEINELCIQEKELDLSSKIYDDKETLELPLEDSRFKEKCLTGSACKSEDLCLIDVQSNVTSFEGIRTEIPRIELIESTLHVGNDKDLIKCDFTDEESDYSNCFDSNELEALFQNDCEKDFDNESKHNSLSLEANSCCFANSKILVKDNNINDFNNKQCINIPNSEHLVADSNAFVVPETELFDLTSDKVPEDVDIGHNVCIVDSDNNKDKRKLENVKRDSSIGDSYSSNKCAADQTKKNFNICSETNTQFDETKQKIDLSFKEDIGDEVGTDSLGTEDFLILLKCRQMSSQSDLQKEISLPDKESSGLNFQCSLRSDINEAVTRLKLAYFNNSQYLFIQHVTWIQVWRQEKDQEWIKIDSHQMEGFELQELCLSQSENYLVLVVLLNSQQNCYCLHFLVFKRESKIIQLLEHRHWFEKNCEEDEKVFLCGLDNLKFASAQGSQTFKVYLHKFCCLEEDPKIMTINLGSSDDCLHSLSRIDKFPNALLGMSNNKLYIWHHSQLRLVTSVCLQLDSSNIESCIWSLAENGLLFLMVACKETVNSEACQLLAVNIATGFCEVASLYTLQPALETQLPLSRKLISYSEPLIGMTCEDGAFLWSVEEENCCAFLEGSNYTSIAVVPTFSDSFLIIVGCNGGYVNCYQLKFKQ